MAIKKNKKDPGVTKTPSAAGNGSQRPRAAGRAAGNGSQRQK